MNLSQPEHPSGDVNSEEQTVLSDPIAGEINTHSSLAPHQQTSSGEASSLAPASTVVGIGSQLGPYQLLDKLGEGGMGAVYKARHTKLGRLVALKVLPPHVLSRPDALSRFEREMKAVGTLSHPNVVQALDAGDFGGVHYLSMEYVEGQDLQEVVKAKGPMSVVNACKAIRQAALGLAAAHKLGLVHRDIKPSNLFVTKETGQIKILDMGLALLSEEQAPAALTSTGQCFGTPDYMAPEQWEDAHTCDARADLYALGCTLFLLLVGRTPYGGDTYRTVPRKMMGHVRDPIPDLKAARLSAVGWTPSSDRSSSLHSSPPSSGERSGEGADFKGGPLTLTLSPEDGGRGDKTTDEGVHPTSDIPDGLDAIYLKLMAKEPKDRFASADQLAEALAPFTRQGRSAKSSPHAPREESRTTSDSRQRSNSDAVPAHSDGSPASALVSRSETATLGEAPADPLSATSTWSPDKAPPASHPNDTIPPRGPRRKWLLTAGGAAAILMLGAIIITITNKDGTKTRIEVPDTSKVEITNAPIENQKSKIENAKVWHGWPADAPPPAIAPFDAEQAQHHQAAWAKYLGVPVACTNSVGMTFVLVPPGEFLMGSTPEKIVESLLAYGTNAEWRSWAESEAPQHRVRISKPFYLAIHKVTQQQYELVMGTNPSSFSMTGAQKEDVEGIETKDFPVDSVAWTDAVQFCEKLAARERQSSESANGGQPVEGRVKNGYRLPTEAEWEFAARGGTTTRSWNGDSDNALLSVDWLGPNNDEKHPHPVGELPANPFGLHDVLGSLFEWCHDGWTKSDYEQYRDELAIDPLGIDTPDAPRTLRGGLWADSIRLTHIASRRAVPASLRDNRLGLRIALSVEAVKTALLQLKPAELASANSWFGWPADAPPPAIAPFDAEQAQHHQEAWAKYLGVPAEYTNSLGMKFRLIPPGEFTMGSTPTEIAAALKDVAPDENHWRECIQSEAPQNKVILSQPIYLGVNEVTQAEYEKVMGVNPSHFAPMGMGKEAVAGLDTTSHPVEMVSWNDAAEFCAKLSQQEKLKPFYFRAGETITPLDGTGYRLPSEAEWECACRAGTATKYWIGDKDEDLVRAGWFLSNSGRRTHAVGELMANPFGFWDIHGNVWEWAEGRWEPTNSRKTPNDLSVRPNEPSIGSRRVIRGGSFYFRVSYSRTSTRLAYEPDAPNINIGLRVSLTLEAVRQALKVTGPAMTKLDSMTKLTPARDPIDFAAERAAAEWVLANKGAFSIAASPDWQWRDYGASDNEKPLPSEPFVITALHMTNSQVKTELDLERLTRCRYLENLTIGGGTIEGPAMDLLTRLPRLKSLVFDQKNLRTSDLSKLGQISTLDFLSITSNMVDDKLEFVRHLPTLRSLKIWGPQPPDIDLLAEAPQLRTILLTTPDAVDDAKLVAVQSRNDKLRIVVGWKGKYRTVGRDPTHEAAKQLVELGVECLGGVNYWQAPSKLLTKADFENGGVWSFSVQKIPASVQLSADDREKLKLLDSYHFIAEGQRESDELAKSLSGNHGIATITMTDCDLTDIGLEHLQKLVSLRNINVTKTKVTPAGVERFHRAVPYCGITSDFGVILPHFMSAATTIPAAPASDRIDFAAERKAAEWVLENKGTMSIAVSPGWSWRDYGASDNAKPLPSEPFVVTILGMTNSQVKTESDLERLTRCRYLEILGISGGTIESPAIDLLTRLPRLKTLTLSDQKNLRTSDLPKLGQISALEHLAITSDMVDDRLEFVRHLPALRTLNIYGPQPPDISLLAEAPQLRTILLPTPDTVDDDKLAAAQARHGQLRIVVGWKGKYRTVGRDPAHEAAKQLVELGVECFGGVNYFQPRTKLLTKADFENGGVWSFSVQKIPASVQLSADDREKLKLLDSYHFTAEGQREADELAKSLSGNHGIATITMTDCDLTDVGLEHLQKLVSLRNINVTKTKVTPAGVERFHRAVPYCWITSDFGVTLPKFISANAAQPK